MRAYFSRTFRGKSVFSHWSALLFLSYTVFMYILVSFLAFYYVPLSSPGLLAHFSNYYIFIISLDICSCNPSHFVLLYECLGYLDLFYCFIQWRISLSRLTKKKLASCLDGIESIKQYGEKWHFFNTGYSCQEHVIPLYLGLQLNFIILFTEVLYIFADIFINILHLWLYNRWYLSIFSYSN